MGATEIMHQFEHHDYRIGIRELKKKADEVYGHQDGYSGEINSVDNFRLHRPTAPIKTNKQLLAYIENRLEKAIETREAEVIDLGVVGYTIAKPVVNEYYGQLQMNPSLLRGLKEPALLLNERGGAIKQGTVASLKEFGKRKVMQERFEHDYYIISKNTPKVYIITGEGKLVKNTSKKNDSSQLILPIHKYVVYGLSPT